MDSSMDTKSFDIIEVQEKVFDKLSKAEMDFIKLATAGWFATAKKSELLEGDECEKDFSRFVSYFTTDNHKGNHEIDTFTVRLTEFMNGNYNFITNSCGIRQNLIGMLENDDIDVNNVKTSFNVVAKYASEVGDRWFWNNLKIKKDDFNSEYVDKTIENFEKWGEMSDGKKTALTVLRDGMKMAEDRLPEISGDVNQMNN